MTEVSDQTASFPYFTGYFPLVRRVKEGKFVTITSILEKNEGYNEICKTFCLENLPKRK